MTVRSFVPVTGIVGVPKEAKVDEPLQLTGTVEPTGATNKTIVWSGTGVENGVLTATERGAVEVLATIVDGKGVGDNYTETFEINVTGKSSSSGCNVGLGAFALAALALALMKRK